jgi:hypothetical protein
MDKHLKRREILNFLWEEVKLRQEQYWSSFNKFGLVIITISFAPYLWPNIALQYGKYILILPIASFVLTLVCTWYLSAEYQRLYMIRNAYEELRSEECAIPRMPQNYFWEKLIAIRIGSATSVIWGICFITVSICNLFIFLKR